MIPSYGSVGSYRHRGGRCNGSIPQRTGEGAEERVAPTQLLAKKATPS